MRANLLLFPLALLLLVAAVALLAGAASAQPLRPVEARLNETVFEAEPQQVVIAPLLVTNRGAVPMVVRVEFVDPPARWQVVPPPPLTLPPAPEGEPPLVYSIPLTVQTPYENGGNNDTAQFRIRVLAAAKDSGEAPTEVARLSFVVHSEGVYVPAPGAWALVALLAGAAAATRRSRPQ